ncbi:hypothetical protein [Streptomyces sp. MZ04]|uniref:DUF6907 domain-containing protein n=1 Tax=Streptomyces sp. MZ04 TaxID=2559236 RepID=UPI00107E8318|nr:hypothetical protein [Streptomyces sp. MZ04]TGB09792.1 hypothetical protein E2651_15695 [Streptomyces sp. MZ04]
MAKSAISTPTITELPALKQGMSLVPALIDGHLVHIECPTAWCVLDHIAENEKHPADVHHYGERRTLTLPVPMLAPITVFLAQWPNAIDEDAGLPYLAVDTDNDVNSYQRTAALALADQLVAFSADVRGLARTLPDEVQA